MHDVADTSPDPTPVPDAGQPAGAHLAREPAGRRPRKRGRFVVKVLLLAALAALAAWCATWSTALEEANRAFLRRDYPLAVRRALDHIQRRPWSRDGALVAARGLSVMGHPESAEPYYQRARRFGALTLDDLRVRANGWNQSTDVEKAIAAYDDILRRAPDDRNALRIVATLHYAMRQYAKARPYAERLSRLRGGERIGYALLGTIAHDDGNPNAAVQAFQKVLELDPNLSALPYPVTLFWSELGQDLIATGRPAEVRERLTQLLTVRDEAELHYVLGRAYQALGENEQAAAQCRRAVERDPKLGGAWLLLARLALYRQEPQEALDDAERAAALLPETYDSVYTLSQTYRQLGKLEEAKRLAKKAEALRAKAVPSKSGMGAL